MVFSRDFQFSVDFAFSFPQEYVEACVKVENGLGAGFGQSYSATAKQLRQQNNVYLYLFLSPSLSLSGACPFLLQTTTTFAAFSPK